MYLYILGISLAIVCSVAGDFFVKQGADRIKDTSTESFGGVWGLLNPVKLFQFLRQLGIFSNGKLWLGIGLLTLHFGGYILAMHSAPVTLVVPLMACTYIIDTIIAKNVLHERVTLLRWAGVAIVVCGVAVLVGFSDFGSQ